MAELEHPPQEPDALPGVRLALIGVGVVVLATALSIVAVLIVRQDLDDAWQPPLPGVRPLPLEATHMPTSPLDEPIPSPHRAQILRAHRFGWVDRDAGLVHVPLDVAMQLRLAKERPPRRSSP